MPLSIEEMSARVLNQEQLINELRTGQTGIREDVDNLGEQTAAILATPPTQGQIDNLIRDSKLRHSWDTWTNDPTVPGDQNEECAHIFTEGPDTAVEVYSGAMNAMSGNPDHLSITHLFEGVGFELADETLEIVVEGAGAAGVDLVTTILDFISDELVQLADAASTTVTDARVRWRLQTLHNTATKTGTVNVNTALKNSGHSHFTDNITDPLWNLPNGYAELGSRNTFNFPLGYWNRDASTWVFQNIVEPSKVYYFICRFARKNATIVPRGFLGAQLWDNSPGKRQVIEGGQFTLVVQSVGTPIATTSSQYKVIARTDQGETLESNVVTVNRPADASFVTDEIYELLTWSFLPGVRIFEIWRKTGATYEELAEITNGNTIYLDQNAVMTTGTAFPEGDIQRAKAETFTREGDLDEVVIDGQGDWNLVRLPIFVPGTYDTRVTTQQWLRAGLTAECDREVTDGVCSTPEIRVESETADFVVEDEGLAIEIVSGNDTFTGLIDTWIDENTVEVNAPVGFDASTATITIVAGGRNGLLIGEFGLSLTPGSWAANHDDSTTARGPASNPNGSGVGSGNPNDPPGGQLYCVRNDMRVRMHGPGREIEELPIRYTQVGNLTASGNLKANCVLKKMPGVADCLLEIHAAGRTIFCTPSEPFFRDFSNFDKPTPAYKFGLGDTIAMNPEGRDVLAVIEAEPRIHFGRFETDTFWALSPGHVSIIEGFYRHNRKNDP